MSVVGVDVGGTFTDLIVVDEEHGEIRVSKVSSVPRDPSVAILRGLERVCPDLSSLDAIIHGTTVATNAVIERKGAVAGLITTRGFRDVLELRRRERPSTYGLSGAFQPLIPRFRRLEVSERTAADGTILTPVAADEIRAAGSALLSAGAEVVVVSFLHSYANPENERQARLALATVWPNDYIILSSEILAEFREFERTSTAVVNAYVQPLIHRYLHALVGKLRQREFRHEVMVIQSNGGMMSVEYAKKFSAHTVLSGPAAGVIAAAAIANEAGFPNAISCDAGGTSLDVSMIVDGNPIYTSDTLLDFGIPLRVSMINISTIGAGGGSVAWIDRAGILQVGPESAGADPGPACYGQGGSRPTVTDANLVLGRINAERPIGSDRVALDVDLARRAIRSTIGEPLGLSDDEAAYAIIEVANHRIANAIRRESIEKGYDPREFVLVAYGGAGPLHAAAVTTLLGLAKAVVPYYPGITAALGCLLADVRHDFVQTVNCRLDRMSIGEIRKIFADMVARGTAILEEEQAVSKVQAEMAADMAYEGQTHVIRPRFSVGSPADLTQAEIIRAFEHLYLQLFGRLIEENPVTLVSLRASIVGLKPKPSLRLFVKPIGKTLTDALAGSRPVFFAGRYYDCPVYERFTLPVGVEFEGPAIIEQPDATTVVDVGMSVTVDALGNLLLGGAR